LSVLLWSSIGFATASAVYTLLLLAAFKLSDAFVRGPSTVGGLVLGALVFIGPFIVSVGGVIAGTAFAIRRHQATLSGRHNNALQLTKPAQAMELRS
jgi:hypothetical protein